jgi:hypothetical protein
LLIGLSLGLGVADAKSPAHPAAPAMATRCREMMADMKAMDARLDEKLAAVNAAQGEAKVDAMAAVLNELVSQRKTMHEKMKGCPMMGQ